jgi:hypothetical protein
MRRIGNADGFGARWQECEAPRQTKVGKGSASWSRRLFSKTPCSYAFGGFASTLSPSTSPLLWSLPILVVGRQSSSSSFMNLGKQLLAVCFGH